MEEARKKVSTEIAEEVKAWIDTPAVQKAIEQTRSAPDADTGRFEAVITTENLDRYQEVIKLDGWDTANYMNNPVVLWGHDSRSLPIGIATSIEVRDGKMIATGKFAPASANPLAQQVRELYDLGMMRATSVGFIEKEREGNLITKAELLEFSFVSIPANPFALSTMVKSGISVNEMVTKGFVVVKEEEPENGSVEPQNDPAAPVVDSDPQEPTQPEEKAIEPLITRLEAVVVALEAKAEADEPERDENEPDDEGADDETARAMRDFDEKRRILQEAATVVGDVLAEARRARERE